MNTTAALTQTIAAIATPAGKGGVGIVRVSGPQAVAVAKAVVGHCPTPRYATFTEFKDSEGHTIDQGIALYFKAPHSFTGEDVLELQGHGGPMVMDALLKTVLAQPNVRLARPGEFTERAFLNHKIDLAQAEAIADLINAGSEQAARSAMRSLEGEFSVQVNTLLGLLTQLRVYVEAALDFPEEEIDFIENSTVKNDLEKIIDYTQQLLRSAKQGALLQEGMTVVIAGKPNAGKSSLLNALSGRDSAIVTPIAGTTRDILRENIVLDGLPLQVIDTAGLQETADMVELEGIRRAKEAIKKADIIVWVFDATENSPSIMRDAILAIQALPGINQDSPPPIVFIKNKVDLIGEKPSIIMDAPSPVIQLSAQTRAGLPLFIEHLKSHVGFQVPHEDTFIARRRHITALTQALNTLQKGLDQLNAHKASELLAEDLKQTQQYLSEITGAFTADDLLGKIFSEFCIGK